MNDRMSKRHDEQLSLLPAPASSPHGDPSVWGPRLIRLLDGQVEAAQRLLALAERQSELLTGETIDELSVVLNERESVVRALVATSAEIEPFVRSIGEGLAPVLREGAHARLRELDRLLTAIGQRDDADCRLLAARREAIGAQLAGLLGSQQAVNAYGGAPATGAAFQDREG